MESSTNDPVNVIQAHGQWDLGSSNYHHVRTLRELCQSIHSSGVDEILWNNAHIQKMSISVIYNDIALHRTPPPWLDFAWNSFSVPKYAMTAWLIMQQRLLTRDRMLRFGMSTSPACVLCATGMESHPHMFNECTYTRIVLSACPVRVSTRWSDFSRGQFLVNNCTQIEKKTAFLYIAAAFFAIWKERNNRIFQNLRCNPTGLIAQIKTKVRDKLYTCSDFRRRARADYSIISNLF